MSLNVNCPKCGFQFDAGSSLHRHVEAAVEARLADQELQVREKALAEAREAVRVETLAKDNELSSARQKLKEAQAFEAGLLQQKAELDQRASEQAIEVARRVDAEREKWSALAKAQAIAEAAVGMKAQKEELDGIQRSLDEARNRELGLLQEKATLEAAVRAKEFELRKQLDVERAGIQEAARKQARDEALLREQENEEKIRQLKGSLEEAQRRLVQGSQQAQGEAQEVVLEQVLRRVFPLDGFTEVGKGVEGADLVQIVRDERGRDCGTILWESKRTKNWSQGWISKLAADRARQNYHVAALVSQALPADVQGIGCVEDIWVSSFGQVTVLAALLRRGLVDAAAARLANAGRADKMNQVYTYLTGPEFQGRAMSMLQALDQLRQQLRREQQAMQRIWTERERLMHQAAGGIDGMRHDLQAIAAADLTSLPGDDGGIRELEELAEVAGDSLTVKGDPGEDDLTFLAMLARCGGASGNIRLRNALAWDEVRYERVKDDLVGRGRIVPGAGRGGTVKLVGGSEGSSSPSAPESSIP